MRKHYSDKTRTSKFRFNNHYLTNLLDIIGSYHLINGNLTHLLVKGSPDLKKGV